ncbi:MAG: hypothetical protein RL065_720 [Bacteroidota bacterium]|jgi:UDP-N-acetylmuramate--alanine ligase
MSKDLEKIKFVYFLGIGGIGMSALARWFHANNRKVAGYDKTSTTLTKQLEAEGIQIHYEDNIALIEDCYKKNSEEVLIVFTPAIPKTHRELVFFQENKFNIKKRAEVLGIITKGMNSIAIGGTHGKTTTSSMTAHILKDSGVDCAAFLGGITQNYETNLLLNSKLDKNTWAVVEADEFDRSFLQLFPTIAVITSTDADHLDIYGDADDVKKSYSAFAQQVLPNGTLFLNEKVSLYNLDKIENGVSIKSYGYQNQDLDFQAKNIRIENAQFVFDFVSKKHYIADIQLLTSGFHNVENATVATAIALEIGIDAEKIKRALASFRGVKRRFEYIVRDENFVFIDDYAHHPTELAAFIQGVKALYPKQKFTIIFQPHLFSRTKDFYQDFAKSLSLADSVILLPIYPARELPIENVSSKMIFDLVTCEEKYLIEKENLVSFLTDYQTDVLATTGAGDIDQFIKPIADLVTQKTL